MRAFPANASIRGVVVAVLAVEVARAALELRTGQLLRDAMRIAGPKSRAGQGRVEVGRALIPGRPALEIQTAGRALADVSIHAQQLDGALLASR